MTLRRHLEEYIRGWLPKVPRQPESGESSKIAASTQTNSRLRTSGSVFSNFGIILILLVTYRFILQVLSPAVSVPGVQIIFATGFVLLVAGMVFRVHSVESNALCFRSPIFTLGLALLTVSVFGIAFNTLVGLNAVNVTFGGYRDNVAAAVVFSIVGFVGWLMLSREQATRPEMASLHKKSFSILAAGAIMNLIVAPIQAFLAFSSSWYPQPNSGTLLTIELLIFIFIAPLGTVFSTYGWAALFSVSTKKHKTVLLVSLAVFIAIVFVSLLI